MSLSIILFFRRPRDQATFSCKQMELDRKCSIFGAMRQVNRFLLPLALLFGVLAAGPEKFDVVLTGGKVIDGTGAAAQLLDVAVKGDKIAKIGKPGTLD